MSNDTSLETGALEDTKRSRPLLAQILVYIGICLAIGCSAALIGKTIQEGFELIPASVVGVIILAGFAMIFLGVKIGDFDPPNFSSKTGRSQLILMLSAGLGAAIGFYLVINGTMDRFFEGDFTISRVEAIAALVLLFFVIMPLAFIRERNADELEKAAAKDAAYWSFSAYLYSFMAWSVAEAGGLVPALNGGYLFLALVFLFLGIWAFKRSG